MNYIQQVYKGKNEWYHWLITIFLVLIGWQLLGVIPLTAVAYAKAENTTEFISYAENNFASAGIDKNYMLFLLLFMFVVGLMFLFIGIKYIHKRSITSLITSREKIDWNRFFFAFFLWGALAVAITFIGILHAPENYTWNFNAKPFFILVAISFIFIPLQTSFEELLFRGYFMQAIGAATTKASFPLYFLSILFTILVMLFLNGKFNFAFTDMIIVFTAIALIAVFLLNSNFFKKIINSNFNKVLFAFFNSKFTPLLLTSLVFGLLHGANPEVAKLGQITMIYYIGTGLLYGITTLMDEGTEIALGLHAVNNITAAFLVTTDWTVFQTDALYRDTSEPSVTWEMFIPVFVLYPLMLWLFSEKYGWTNWKEKLTGKIEVPANFNENYKTLDDIGEA